MSTTDRIDAVRMLLARRRALRVGLALWLSLSVLLQVAGLAGALLGIGWGLATWSFTVGSILVIAGIVGMVGVIVTLAWAQRAGVLGARAVMPVELLDGALVPMGLMEWCLVGSPLVLFLAFFFLFGTFVSGGLVVLSLVALVLVAVPTGIIFGCDVLLRRAVRQDPQRAAILLRRLRLLHTGYGALLWEARLALLQGQLERAHALALRGRRASLPGRRLAVLVRTTLQWGQHDAAREWLGLWLEVDLTAPEPHVLLALTDLLEGRATGQTLRRLELAEELTSRSLGRGQLMAVVQAGLAWACAVLDQPEDARRALAQAEQLPCHVPEWVTERDLALHAARAVLETPRTPTPPTAWVSGSA